MLLSLLFTFTPAQPTYITGFYGREVRAWFLKTVAQYDQQLAEHMHSASGPKPYTVSDLIIPSSGRREEEGRMALVPGNECQIRITSLSKPLSELILTKIVPVPQNLHLKWSSFRQLRLSIENEWCEQATFEELVERAQNACGESVTLEFTSPTAFRSGSIDLALPTSDQVWRSLWWRWNSVAPPQLQIDPLWPEFAANCIVVSDFILRSRRVIFKRGEKGAATGCVGRVTYHLLPEKDCGEYAPLRPGAEQVLCTLAGFALFSGVGHHTTIGLGQTRWLKTVSQ